MKHLEYITTTRTWTCPATGAWKIICVGGGASGKGENSTGVSGNRTSFGTYFAAEGGRVQSSDNRAKGTGGYGGYTGMAYGGSPGMVFGDLKAACPASGNGGGVYSTGFGYGAGGGAWHSTYNEGACPGGAGRMECMIVDLVEGETVACTVGTGGAGPGGYATAGNAGVIVAQYLGDMTGV